jgi:hypothetical protein
MPAAAILPVKALLAETDLIAIRAVLASLRRGADAAPSLREPLSTWLKEHGLLV